MKRSLLLSLNNVPNTPPTLLDRRGQPLTSLAVPLRQVYHHRYLDTYDVRPPTPNPFYEGCRRFITGSQELEFKSKGLGSHKEARIAETNALGKAFCRWFLDKHFGIPYFAHMDDVLGSTASARFGGVSVQRNAKGNAPDYLCADGSTTVYLAEAKGRYSTDIGFNSAAFQEWRNQIGRVDIVDQKGVKLTVKGYVVGTRFRVQHHPASVHAGIFAEDPETRGERGPDEGEQALLRRLVLAKHYSAVLSKIGLPVHADVLYDGVPVGAHREAVGIWRCTEERLNKLQFVAAFPGLARFRGPRPFREERSVAWEPTAWLANRSDSPVFLGLELNTFYQVLEAVRGGWEEFPREFRPLRTPDEGELGGAQSLLADGTLLASKSVMELEEVRVI